MDKLKRFESKDPHFYFQTSVAGRRAENPVMETSTLNISIICITAIILSFIGWRKRIYLEHDKNPN